MRPTLATLVLLAVLQGARAATLQQLEQEARENPGSAAARAALAEAYLHDCQLEDSLAQWQALLRLDPQHPRARLVVDRLTAQALDLDTQLQTLQTLVEKGISDGTADLLDAAAQRAATATQKARILYLRARLAQQTGEAARARAGFEAARQLYPHTPWAGRATLALARVEEPGEAQRLLRGVLADPQLDDPSVKQMARLELLLVESADLTLQERIAAVRGLLAGLTDPEARRETLGELAGLLATAQGRWVPEAVEAIGTSLATGPPGDEAEALLGQLLEIARESRDPETLDSVATALERPPLEGQALLRKAAFVRVEALLARSAVADTTEAMERRLREAHGLLDRLAGEADAPDRSRAQELRGRALLLEAQKRVALDGATTALPVLTRAKDHYLAILASDPEGHQNALSHIGRLLEQMREWETAAELYRETAARSAHTAQGRDALRKQAELCEGPLNAPLLALDLYAQYAARYPAELPYRQLDVGRRLRQLGYANVLDFQKRNRLNPDGIFGSRSRARLEELEATFDLIALRAPQPPCTHDDPAPLQEGEVAPVHFGEPPEPRPESPAPVLRGQFIHQTMFSIACGLDEAGRDHDAALAYRMFLNLFPTKREADDALLAIARIFADNLLFSEALGAYAELMEDFPKGDKTSEAYIEAARCHENLGQWDPAKRLYELYRKKFPKYHHVELCEARIPLLEEIQQYQDFIATSPESPKLAEAQYQIGTILYKQFGNHTKAAVEFAKVAEKHPGHVRAADALFSAGVAQLRAENFPAARQLFARLVATYPDTRLADDAQYWAGHTHEYAARALGKLDELRIVVKRRDLEARAELLADLDLRRRYHPTAQPGPEVPEDIWGGDTLGVLASGSKRDRVNADLFRAIRAYQEVVDRFPMGDMVGPALLRIGTIYTKYLKDPEKGMAAFQQLLDRHPGTKEAIGALFEVGAYHLEKKHHDAAIKAYQKFVYNYPQHEKVEDALVAIARAYVEQKAWDKALDACQSYLNRFPEGRHAEFAKNQITWIRMYHF